MKRLMIIMLVAVVSTFVGCADVNTVSTTTNAKQTTEAEDAKGDPAVDNAEASESKEVVAEETVEQDVVAESSGEVSEDTVPEEFRKYDKANMSSADVLAAIGAFAGKPIAIVVQPSRIYETGYCNNAYNYGTLLTFWNTPAISEDESLMCEELDEGLPVVYGVYCSYDEYGSKDKEGINYTVYQTEKDSDFIGTLYDVNGEKLSYNTTYFLEYNINNKDEESIGVSMFPDDKYHTNLIRNIDGDIIGIFFRGIADKDQEDMFIK